MGDLLQHLFRWNFTSAHMRGAVSHGQSLKWACQLMVSMSAWWGNIIPHLREKMDREKSCPPDPSGTLRLCQLENSFSWMMCLLKML